MLLPISECARLTGVSRSALLKAIQRGRVSASKDTRTGQWVIESAELSRVYAVLTPAETERTSADNAVLEEQLRAAAAMLSQLREERDYLRQRLEDESAERRRLTALLTHQEPASPSADDHQALVRRLFRR